MKPIDSGYRYLKRAVFTRPLIEKILARDAQVTYRKTRMSGYYYLAETRFKPVKDAKQIIHVYRSEKVDPDNMTDGDAQLAGVDSINELRSLVKKWYGDPMPQLYRNWFRLISDV